MRRTLLLALGLSLAPVPTAWADAESAWQGYRAGHYQSALHELAPLAEAGDAAAQYALGSLYSDGLAVPRNYRAAAAWFERAALQDHPKAQFSLGFLTYYGAGRGAAEGAVAPDPAAAARWLEPAAEAGNPMAQMLLGRLYHQGAGVARSDAAALKWCLFAAEQGLVPAQFEVGVLLASEPKGWRSWIEAYKWFRLAADAGHPAAAQNLEIVAAHLNHEEIEEAEALAASWQPVT